MPSLSSLRGHLKQTGRSSPPCLPDTISCVARTASLRPLRFMVLFDHPSAEQRVGLWRSALPARVPLASDVDFQDTFLNLAEGLAYFCFFGNALTLCRKSEKQDEDRQAARPFMGKTERQLTDAFALPLRGQRPSACHALMGQAAARNHPPDIFRSINRLSQAPVNFTPRARPYFTSSHVPGQGPLLSGAGGSLRPERGCHLLGCFPRSGRGCVASGRGATGAARGPRHKDGVLLTFHALRVLLTLKTPQMVLFSRLREALRIWLPQRSSSCPCWTSRRVL